MELLQYGKLWKLFSTYNSDAKFDINHEYNRLVATLGSRSTITRKVQKKDIVEVNLPKACETIIHPEAPLALRLQSNLLYGISRVFKEQYTYFHADVQSAHLKLSKEFSGTLQQTIAADFATYNAR